jgi:RNA polymerase sigma-70 factor (ECF subfamily)
VERELEPGRLGDHIDRLYRAAWALCGSREDAEDLVQETFARVLSRPRFLRRDEDVPYLLRVLRNTFLNQRRAAGRRPQTVAAEPIVLEYAARDESARPDVAAEANLVYAAIAELPDDLRAVVVAVDVTGLTYGEAAGALRIPEGTVMSRLFRARQRLVRALEGNGAAAAPDGEG